MSPSSTDLCHLPDEVLEMVLKALVPPFRSSSLAVAFGVEPPTDLFTVRLVSHRLHRLATPLAWRRLHLSLRSCRYCAFFERHPHLSSHVRLLLLNTLEATAPTARAALRAATQAMTRLRAVLVWDAAGVLEVSEINALLVGRPLLRAVCLMDMGVRLRELVAGGVKMLHVGNAGWPAGSVTSGLECLSVEVARRKAHHRDEEPQPTLRELPWATLREVALVDCDDEDEWMYFLDGFKIHKSLSLPTPLTELLLGNLSSLSPHHLASFLQTFLAHPHPSLTHLTLYHIPSHARIPLPTALPFTTLTPTTLLQTLPLTFPNLIHLTLLTDCDLLPWPTPSHCSNNPLQLYASLLSKLPFLQSLAWNNFRMEESVTRVFARLGEESLKGLYSCVVKALGRWWLNTRAPTLSRKPIGLRTLGFVSITEGIVDWVELARGPHPGEVHSARARGIGEVMRGEEVRVVAVKRSMETMLHTTSWSTGAGGGFEDI